VHKLEGCKLGQAQDVILMWMFWELTVSLKRRPVSATAASSSSPASSNAEKASADSTSAHL
jgi:hypothetical protein